MAADETTPPPSCAVIGPLFYLTVTVEVEGDGSRVHLHPGGQGFWIARMVRSLGCRARLVAPIAGEAGDVLAALMPGWEVELEPVRAAAQSPTQVQDRRSGDRVDIVELEVPRLDRHEADDLYGCALETALGSDAIVLTSGGNGLLPDDAYARLVHDVTVQRTPVFADMHGPALDAALEGGSLHVLKVSEDDLAVDGWEVGSEPQAVAAARTLVERGASTVVVSRGGEPAIAAVGERVIRFTPPTLAQVDHRGAGDSMTGAIVAGHLHGLDVVDAIRLGAAAGAGNVTRRGLGSGSTELILSLTELVEVEDIS